MSARFSLHRTKDPSGVSGTGRVAEGVEWDDGAVAVRWSGDHPSTATWNDIRDVEAIHGHEGLTTVEYVDSDRLLEAYKQLVDLLLEVSVRWRPLTAVPHPDRPNSLRLTFIDRDAWEVWVRRLDGSPEDAVNVEVDGEMEHRWSTPDGLLWLQYYTPLNSRYTHDPIHDPRD